MNKEKKARKGGRVLLSIGCVLLVLLLVANVAANYFSRLLDVYVGLGEATITTKEGAENWDTEYYSLDSKTAEEADKVAKDVTRRIAEEGIVLMKNENGALPMAAGAVSLMGRRSVETVFGGTGSGAGDHDRVDAAVVEQRAEHLADQHREGRRRAEPRARGQGTANLDIGTADLDPELGKGRGHAAHERFGRAELRRAYRQMVKPDLEGLEALRADTEKPAVVRLIGCVKPQIHARGQNAPVLMIGMIAGELRAAGGKQRFSHDSILIDDWW